MGMAVPKRGKDMQTAGIQLSDSTPVGCRGFWFSTTGHDGCDDTVLNQDILGTVVQNGLPNEKTHGASPEGMEEQRGSGVYRGSARQFRTISRKIRLANSPLSACRAWNASSVRGSGPTPLAQLSTMQSTA